MSLRTSGTYEIHVARRATLTSPFNTPVRVDELAGDSDDVEVSADGQTLAFASPGTNDNIYISTRSCQ